MSSESQKPQEKLQKKLQEFGPVPEYKAHFELWNETSANHVAPAATTVETAEVARSLASAEAVPPEPEGNDAVVKPSNGRRRWTKPILSTIPLVAPTPRELTAPAPQSWVPFLRTVAAVIVGVLLAVLVMRPWRSAKAPVSKPKHVPRAMAKVQPALKAKPSVAISAKKAAPAPAKAVAAAPAKVAVAAPAAKPSIAAVVLAPRLPSEVAPSKVAAAAAPSKPLAIPVAAPSAQPVAMASIAAPIKPAMPAPSTLPLNFAAQPAVAPVAKPAPIAPTIENPSDTPSAADSADNADNNDDDVEEELAPVRTLILESSVRSELARDGFSNLGISVTADGDVFLNGTFLNLADEDRVIAMIRGNKGVRDIYFSGTVWHNGERPDVATVSPPTPPLASKPSTAPPQPISSAQAPSAQDPAQVPARSMIAHPADFPVTAAEAPAPHIQYAAPAPPQPSAAASPQPERRSIFPFRWMRKFP